MSNHRLVTATATHEAFRQDMIAIVSKYSSVDPVDMLAVASAAVGQLIALQDQRTMTNERALKIVIANMEAGNKAVIDNLRTNTAGTA